MWFAFCSNNSIKETETFQSVCLKRQKFKRNLQAMNKEKVRRKVRWKRLEATTNFYPTYVDGNKDKVTPTAATFTTQFQTVIPRYNLSMTETRNEGTGPTFLETEYQPTSLRPKTVKKSKEHVSYKSEPIFKLPRHKKKKIRTDFWK